MSTYEMPPTTRGDRTLELRDYVDIINRRKLQILLVIAVLLGLLLGYALTRPTLYETTTQVLVEPIPNPITAVTSNPQAFLPNMDTEKELVTSDAAARLVAEKLAVDTQPSDLLEHVTGGFIVNTSVLTVTYQDPDPATAARLADAFGEAYISLRTSTALRQIVRAGEAAKKQAATLKHQLKVLDAEIANASPSAARTLQDERTTLADRLTTTEQRASQIQQNVSSQEGGRILEHAKVPSSSSSPNLPLFVLLGVLGGLILGVATAFLRESLGDHIRDVGELERLTGAPVIAEVSAGRRWGRRRSSKLMTIRAPQSRTSEGYRTLASYLQRLKGEGGSEAFMVTSPSAREGKSEVAANLGVALAEAANSVIVVDANLRSPEIQSYFPSKETETQGLATMLEDVKHPQTVVADWSRRVEDQASLLSPNGSRPGQLKIIGNGAASPNPAAILSNGRVGGVFEALRTSAEFLVVDAPQVLGVSDTSILTRHIDGALLVVNARKSTRRALEQARRALDIAGTRLVGCVFVTQGR
jgi:tyrosine-protein kinase